MGTILRCSEALINRIFTPCDILVEGDTIVQIAPCLDAQGHTLVDLRGKLVLPGLIDTHIHGFAGSDTMDAEPQALETMSRNLLKAGVTSFYPTLMTGQKEDMIKALKNVADFMEKTAPGATVMGSFAEGPFISAEYRGAQPLEAVSPVDFSLAEELHEASRGTLKKMIVAPELPHAPELCRWLCRHDIMPVLGHSAATYEEARACIEEGAQAGVHTFNAMAPFHHREPGLLGAILCGDELFGELILDGIHVESHAARVLYRCRGWERTVLISDCMRAGGMEDGEYMLGDTKTIVKDGVARTEEGRLAGSTLKLIDAVRNAAEFFEIPLEQAVAMAAETPARLMGCFEERGTIVAGKKADIIAIDSDFHVHFAMAEGRIGEDFR